MAVGGHHRPIDAGASDGDRPKHDMARVASGGAATLGDNRRAYRRCPLQRVHTTLRGGLGAADGSRHRRHRSGPGGLA